MGGKSSGPSKAQKIAQAESHQLAKRAEEREIARDRSLQERIRARQRARRFGQFGRRSLAFNPGRRDLGTTPNADPVVDPAVDPAATGGKRALSAFASLTKKTVAVGTGRGTAPPARTFRSVSA